MLAGLVLISGLVVSACVDLEPASTATPRTTPTPRPTFTPAGAGSAGCEACHGDKEKLKEVAAAEAEKDNGAVACKG
jgi:hypothetical protein